MATNGSNNWSDLLDVVLFGAEGVSLGQPMEHASDAIHRRMEELLKDENAGSVTERVALRNALVVLGDLQKMAHARKPSGSVRRRSGESVSDRF